MMLHVAGHCSHRAFGLTNRAAVSRMSMTVAATAQRSEDLLWSRIIDTYSSASTTGAISSIPAQVMMCLCV